MLSVSYYSIMNIKLSFLYMNKVLKKYCYRPMGLRQVSFFGPMFHYSLETNVPLNPLSIFVFIWCQDYERISTRCSHNNLYLLFLFEMNKNTNRARENDIFEKEKKNDFFFFFNCICLRVLVVNV